MAQTMGTADRESETPLGRWLQEEPYRFNFFQAVRLLLRAASLSSKEPDEGDNFPVRFGYRPTFAFAPSDVQDIVLEPPEDPAHPRLRARMDVACFSLLGHDGPLPDHYTAAVIRQDKLHQASQEKIPFRERTRQSAFHAFLEIFNHRLVEIFYRAWQRSRFFVTYERGAPDPMTLMVSALTGLRDPAAVGLRLVSGRLPLFYSGSLLRRPLSSEAVSRVLSGYFNELPISVEQFEGRWLELAEESCCELGNAKAGTQLGVFCPLGTRVWDVQGQVKLRVGPLSFEDYLEFGPDGEKRLALVEAFRYLTGGEVDATLELVLAETRAWQLGIPASGSGELGRTTWLGGREGELADESSRTVSAFSGSS